MVPEQLPYERVFNYRRWPTEDEHWGHTVNFRLLYKGPLPSNGRPKEKHAIRREFHKQLAALWNENRLLSVWLNYQWIGPNADENSGKTYAQVLADKYALGEFKFLPLVTADHGLVSRLSWKWRKRSSVKIAERTYEKRAQALHC